MWWKKLLICVSLIVFVFSGGWALADCPSADLTGDCFVDFEDFAVIGAQWLNGYDWNDVNTLANQWLTTEPCVPDDMAYIPEGEFEMGDHHDDGSSYELPVHAVLLDAFFMSRYEITNQQYCNYLNFAYPGQIKVDGGIVYASSDDPCDYPYCSTSSAPTGFPDYGEYSQIDYNDVSGTFSVRTKGGRDMSNDPMVGVSWYGAAAYCNWRSVQEGYQQLYDPCDPSWPCDFSKNGYRLPTEAEWEYAARGGEHSPYYRFPWGDTISHSQANYKADPCSYSYDVNPTSGFHPDYNDVEPYTAPVGSFSPNGYGLYDMAGNVSKWCNDWYDYDENYYDTSPYDNPTGPASGISRVIRGGSWYFHPSFCRVTKRLYNYPVSRKGVCGLRIVLNLN